jgi:hypothetical protein
MLASAGVLLAAAITACGSDAPGPAQPSSSSSGAPVDGGTDAEAALPQPRPTLCEGLAPSTVIDEISRNPPAPPPLGGTIAVGKYDIDELYDYGGVDAGPDAGAEPPNSGLSGRSGSGTLVVTADSLAFLEAYGPTGALAPPTVTGYAYTAEGTTISAAQVCPTTAPTKAIPYSASGNSLALFPAPSRRIVYRLRPEQ